MEPVEPAFVAVGLIYLLRETPSMKLLRIAPIAILACALALTACANTVRGVGKDVKSTARAVKDTVTKP
jgi:predicted small secreted protein